MKNKNLKIVLIGQMITLFGSAIQRFGLSLFLLELTGNAATYANVLAISTLPYIICAPIAGAIVDRFNRKKIMVTLDFLNFGLLVCYMITLVMNVNPIFCAGLTMVILSFIATIYTPAVTASLPQIVEGEELKVANGMVSQVGAAANILGPIGAGILYGFMGIKVIVLCNIVSFLISGVMELFLEIPDLGNRKIKISILGSYKEMGDTILTLKKSHRVVLGIIASYALFNICLVPVTTIMLPYILNVVVKITPFMYGIVEGFLVLGILLSGILVSKKQHKFPFSKVYVWNFPMFISLVILGISMGILNSTINITLLWTFTGMVIMFCLGVGNIVTLTFIQQRIPVEQIGKVCAFSTAVATATVPVGQTIFGYFIDRNTSIVHLIIVAAIINLFVSIFVMWNVNCYKSEESLN